MNVFVLAILFYLLYRFIGGFLIPLFRASRVMRQQFQDMNGRQNGPARPPDEEKAATGTQGKTGNSGSGSSKMGEYIDFEEVK